MNKNFEELKKAYEYIRSITAFEPYAAIVLGSGLGELADEIKAEATINYSDIEGFPVSTVQGHKGRFVFGYIGEVPVAAMQGRVHIYEGYTPQQAVMPIRLMSMLGARILLLTNAAGGTSADLAPGDLMVIRDHISCFVPSPLTGENIDELGTRFPDMSSVYDRELSERLLSLDGCLKQGVYCQLAGPQYETPAEVRLVRMLGADAVGMSTAVEAAAAVHCGMRVCGVSCITNFAAGVSDKPLSHSEVQETADRVSLRFKSLIKDFAAKLG